MMKIKKAFILISNAFIALVLLQTCLKPIPDMILSGAEKKVRMPYFTLSDWINREFQNRMEQWLKQNLGFRGFFVKTDNQINYTLFNEFSRNHPRKLILGKNKYLYEEPYIDLYNRISVAGLNSMEETAASLKSLQDVLKKHKVEFLLIITPSKTSIYPEYIPEKVIIRKNLSKKDSYQIFIPLLKRYGVNFLDGRKLFLALKKQSVPNLFPTSGSHWSLYGSYLFDTSLIEQMERLLGKRLVRIASRGIVRSREPIDLDKDIARLGNILFTRSLFTEYLYPDTYPDAPSGAYRPNILLVGSSFCWNIIHYLDINRVFSRLDFYYYFNTDYVYPGKKRNRIDKDRVDWNRDVLTRDIVIIEVNEVAMDENGYQFIETALRGLER
ncbi:MAG: hypothetical protein A2176_06790 [Spirochaetes bacterium RBG_13_51_14]|nr:MAG: hypothetical protein A2176_06790 [Spirochaetes bacterium RBG_13_51_14]